jgi:polysaccharide export outer membrane protein
VTSSSGPDPSAVEAQALVKIVSADGKRSVGIDYALIDISKSVLAYVADTVMEPSMGTIGIAKDKAPALSLGVGDVVQVAVFEAQAGGLFIPSDAGSRPGNFISLPQQTIGHDGTITVPYAGRIRASGRAVAVVQADIERRLADRAIDPQVVITKINGSSAEVSILGDVNTPSRIELTDAGARLLDVIAKAGGLRYPNIETTVTLQRHGRLATIRYKRLSVTPSENIFAAPGDSILVERERRTFLAFGASGGNGRIDFEETTLTLAEALGKAGGLLDSRADASQVMLYRQSPKALLVKLGVDVSRFPDETVPVIFRANLKDPSAFFAIQKFPMQDKDAIYISNSSSVEIIKFLGLLNAFTSTISGVSNDALDTKDAIRHL